MDMPSVEDTVPNDDGVGNIEKSDFLHEQQQAGRRISRVSKLRDMFQNGIIRPIEEIDNVLPFEESLPECDRHPDIHMLPRSFPGSPPLSALRAHRMSLAANNNPSLVTNNCSKARPPAGVSQQSPPICPPKPRHLLIDKFCKKYVLAPPVLPSPPPAVPTDKDYCLKTCIQLFENGCSKTNDRLHNGTASAYVPVVTACTLSTDGSGSKLSVGDGATVPREVAASVSITPTSACLVTSTPSLPGDNSPTAVETDKADSFRDNSIQETSDLNASTYATPVDRLGSWKGSVVRSRDNCQQVVLQPDDFQSRSSHGDGTSAPLQHAESVAVATPDDEDENKGFVLCDEDKPGNGDGGPVLTVQPTLPVPSGLKVVAVDPEGVHILDDGNFFYAYRRAQEDEDDQATGVADELCLREAPVGKENGGALDEAGACLPLTDDEDDEEKKPRVRFSTEPVVAYSTYSITEYNRRNEDIDPLAASAEYELERRLEHMQMVNVDLNKGPQGLGFSILGLGVDQFGANQKLGIFIKLLTPGGAAESDGRIQIYDQIVEVDGISLVGVTSEFAAKTLCGTQDVVHFVMAREKDPENSWVAKLLRQQEEMHDYTNEDGRADSEGEDDDNDDEEEIRNGRAPGDRFSNDPDTLDTFLPREDSYEILHKLASEEERVPDVDGELNRPLEFTANPVFESTRTSEPDTMAHFSPPSQSVLAKMSCSPLAPASHSSTSSSTGTPPPRSALKGTATAASTQRRGEAIDQLISLAMKEVKHSFPSDDPIDMGDRVAWYLASNLHDCQGALAKQRSQLRSVEQRLTAQEAAADEAIERLCLQCRHAESELTRLREELKRQQEENLLLLAHRGPPTSPKQRGHREELQHGSPSNSRQSACDNNSVMNNGESVQPVPINDKPVPSSAATSAEMRQNGSTHSPEDSSHSSA